MNEIWHADGTAQSSGGSPRDVESSGRGVEKESAAAPLFVSGGKAVPSFEAKLPAQPPCLISIAGMQHSVTDNTYLSKDGTEKEYRSSASVVSFSAGITKMPHIVLNTDEAEKGLWERLEHVMAAKQSHVQQVLEEFGIVSDVPPDSDPLEEQMWQIVQGEISMQDVSDLV